MLPNDDDDVHVDDNDYYSREFPLLFLYCCCFVC